MEFAVSLTLDKVNPLMLPLSKSGLMLKDVTLAESIMRWMFRIGRGFVPNIMPASRLR